MRGQKNRVIIDSNIWISFLLSKEYLTLNELLFSKNVTLLYSDELVAEFIEVTRRDKFKKYFDEDDAENVLLQIKNQSVLITVESKIVACRDPNDDFLLALAVDGKATHLITGDKDLLVLKRFGKTKILTLKEYLIGK